jgi:hypothetical protein
MRKGEHKPDGSSPVLWVGWVRRSGEREWLPEVHVYRDDPDDGYAWMDENLGPAMILESRVVLRAGEVPTAGTEPEP